MKRIIDEFHSFIVKAGKCNNCNEIIYNEQDIRPILELNKREERKNESKYEFRLRN